VMARGGTPSLYRRARCARSLDAPSARPLQRALAAGAVLERPVQSGAWGKLAVMPDPFGHGFCLIQFLGRGYDEIATQSGGARGLFAAV
jgi:hypothetical protein